MMVKKVMMRIVVVMMCVCVCVFAVLDIVNILDLFLPVVITHTAPSLGLFVPSHTSVLLRSSSV